MSSFTRKFEYGLNVFFTDKEVPDVFARPHGEQSAPILHAPENVSVTQDGTTFVVRVAKNITAAAPIIFDIAVAEAHRIDRLEIHAEEGSTVTVIERIKSTAPEAGRIATVHIVAATNAHVTHVSVQDMEEDAAEFVARTAEVSKDAHISWIACVTGGAFTQNHACTALVGEGASVKARALFFGARAQKFDLYAEADHQAPHTHADLAGRGALMDSAKAIARGMVRIPTGSKKSTAKEREDVLVFGSKAEADVIPNLEIAEGDVRCAHGAAIGRIDEDKLFYLMSRGLDRTAALTFAVEGFFAPILDEMRDEGLRDAVQCLLAEKVASAFAKG